MSRLWLVSSLVTAAFSLGCEFNRDGLRCEPRIEVGGRCGLALSADEAPAREPVIPGLGGTGTTPDLGCTEASVCDQFGTLTCQSLPGPGQPCLGGGLCGGLLVCDFETSRCEAKGLDGEPCPFGVCAPGHRCFEGTCVLTERFSPCLASAECPAGHFCEPSGTRSCLPQLDLGAACQTSEACRPPAVCSVDGRCVAPLSQGDDCRDACGAGLFCSAREVFDSGDEGGLGVLGPPGSVPGR